ncbi:MAG TPA: HYR domain-containing protein [Flavobacteriales bacterium]|nr:HYR domain-containing protein [Flavobacteriales bacterium]
MKKFLLATIGFAFLSSAAIAQTYLHPTTGIQNTYAGNCMVSGCTGNYYDNGGAAGNYSNNINNIYRTFCPNTPGQCMRLTFQNSVALDQDGFGCWDFLIITDSPTQNGPTLFSGCNIPAGTTFTSNNPSGCITVRFLSDNVINTPGWFATLSCVPCSGGAGIGPQSNTIADCNNAQFVCDNLNPVTANSSGPGLIADACVSDCVIAENYSNWYIINVTTPGTFGMTIVPNPVAADYDFALYGPVVGGCSGLGTPIRCSYASNTGNTGMGNGAVDNSEDVNGNGWVAPANLAVGTYYLLINQWDDYPSAGFQLDFNGTAVVGLPSPVPSAAPVSCSNSVLNLSVPTIAGATYSWTGPGGWTSNVQNPSRNPVVAGTYTLTYTVNGCTSPGGSVVVTIPPDVTAPTITCPSNQTANTSAGSCTASVTIPNPVTNDNCQVSTLTWAMTGATVANSPGAGINNVGTFTFNAGVTTVTYTVRDASSNPATCSFTVTVTDNINPTITCPSNQTGTTGAAGCTASVTSPNPTTGDNCGVTTLTWAMTGATTGNSPGAGINNIGTQTFNTGVTTVTYTVRDAANNVATCSYTVTVTDNAAPTITGCPANTTGNVNASCQYIVPSFTGSITVSDNCTAPASITRTQSPVAGTILGVGVHSITINATDAAGNTANCSFTITVTDNSSPLITGCPANTNGNVNASCQYTVPNFATSITVSDNCTPSGSITVVQSPAAGSNLGVGVHTITLTATDANGNNANCSFTVTVTDNTVPVISGCPSNQTANVNASCTYTVPNFTTSITVSDNCTPAGSIVVSQSPVAGTTLGVGNHTITITATDAGTNIATCSFQVSVADTQNPVITGCPGNQNVTANASCQFVIADYLSGITATDNCGMFSLTQSPIPGTVVSGTQTVTIQATDNNGNISTCTFQVIVADNTPPTITGGCPANTTGNVNASCQYIVPNFNSSISVTDNCSSGANLTITQSPAAGTALGTGTHTITITVADANGNSDNCSFTVTVTDASAPTFTSCPPNQTVPGNASCQGVLGDYTSTAIVNDNCGGSASVTVTQSPAAGTTISGPTTVTLTATDASGNANTCTFSVSVADAIAPTFVTCAPNQNEAPDANCQFTLPSYTTLATVSDNCSAAGSITITQSPSAGTVITGTTIVTLTATDGAGNSATCTFSVILTDNTAPVVTNCVSPQNVNITSGCTHTLGDYTSQVTYTDNCGSSSVTVTQNPAAGTAISAGTTTVTLTLTDANGNQSTCNFTVTVADTEAPVINCTANINSCNQVVTFVAPTATDNCGTATVVQTDATGLSSGSTFPIGTTTLTYSATDAAGNISTCSFTVTVDAATSPAVAGPDVIVCDTVNTVTITATAPSNGTGTWVILSGAGTIGTPTSATTTVTNLSNGTSVLAWVVTPTGACPPTSDSLLIVMSTCFEIIIPTGFTPDGDGTNDVWEIPFLNLYHPNCTVQVFNRWGAKLFESTGYADPWDGSFKGNKMPVGSYYFVIDFADGSDPVKGTVTIIR